MDRRQEGRAWAALMAGVRNLGSRKQPSSSGITARDFLLQQLISTTKTTSGTLFYNFTIKCYSSFNCIKSILFVIIEYFCSNFTINGISVFFNLQYLYFTFFFCLFCFGFDSPGSFIIFAIKFPSVFIFKAVKWLNTR